MNLSSQRRRGRPPTFGDAERKYIAEFVREHGARDTVRICPFDVSLKTVLSVARQHQIELKPGRRPKRAA